MARLLSMTGFGRGSAEVEGVTCACDVRSVNHRFVDVKVRLPRDLLPLEPRVVERVRAAVGRGRVDVTIRVDVVGRSAQTLEVDADLAVASGDALGELARAVGDEGSRPTVESLAALDGVLKLRPVDLGESAQEPLLAAVDAALAEHARMRGAEGQALQRDLAGRLSTISEAMDEVEERVEEQLPRLRDRLTERLRTLMGETPVDPERILTEAAILADRSDVSEEIVRLRQHLAAFREAIDGGGTVGRKLDFLAQELLREANTMGSKAWDAPLSMRVIDIKSEIERIREQVQNVE